MSYFADLSPCTYFGVQFAEQLRAVGWLSPNEPYSQGDVSEIFFERLCHLLQTAWKPVQFCDAHECEFCPFTGGKGEALYRSYKITGTSSSNIFIPGEGFIYVAPDSIAHYIDAHEYCPPDEFCDAVMDCPEMQSRAYVKALLKNCGSELRKSFKPKFKLRRKHF